MEDGPSRVKAVNLEGKLAIEGAGKAATDVAAADKGRERIKVEAASGEAGHSRAAAAPRRLGQRALDAPTAPSGREAARHMDAPRERAERSDRPDQATARDAEKPTRDRADTARGTDERRGRGGMSEAGTGTNQRCGTLQAQRLCVYGMPAGLKDRVT
jgi:hypothetical protein